MVTCAHQYGLGEDDLQQIQNILSLFSHIGEVTLFGSQAKRDYKCGSDIDLCVKGKYFNRNDLSTLFVIFDASLLPYFVELFAITS